MFEDEDLPAALLRIGFELADGRRVSNLGGRRAHRELMTPGAEPEGPTERRWRAPLRSRKVSGRRATSLRLLRGVAVPTC